MKRVLVTGGAGYIGSHTAVELMKAGREVVLLDNFSNSRRDVPGRVASLGGRECACLELDVRDRAGVRLALQDHAIDAVIHFAGVKSIGESVARPLHYYENNVNGSTVLCEAMLEAGVKTLVFSSSATVYGDPASNPVAEDAPLRPTAPYGRSKLFVEQIVNDLARAGAGFRVANLRYFNPAGAHESGLIGEDPLGVPGNLVPYLCRVAAGELKELAIFGDDYATPDGTGVRDYIHVMDLAAGHVAALNYLEGNPRSAITLNLGTGRGVSVLEMVAAFERASGRRIPRTVVARRPGDVAMYYANPTLAQQVLGWRAGRDVDAMCRDAWRWQQAAAAPV